MAACAQPVRYGGRPGFDLPTPYDGTDPAAGSGFRPSRDAPTRFYAPPGPAADPWGPYIRDATRRFRVPEQWVRAVMHQESGGQEQAVSSAGAMGLMQVMPATYATLSGRYALGRDAFDPRNNIMAGVAYIREMYDRFGSPGFLAAYNAGPDRLDAYLSGDGSLPDETVNYLAAIAPHLGTEVAMSGPLAPYAANGRPAEFVPAPTPVSFAAGCDPNAAYDPDLPCASLVAASFAPATPALGPASARHGCDLDAAFDPARVCTAGSHGWAIQVGAFNSPGLARVVAETARSEARKQLATASVEFPVVASAAGTTLYRARLTNLSAAAAVDACAVLTTRQLPCVVVDPSRPS